MFNANEFVAAARTWLGVRYVHQGRSRFGVDCIGFPIALVKELGLMPKEFVDYHSYGRTPDGLMEPIVRQYCEPLISARAGCLILIKWPRYKQASHAAIIAGKTMIHSYQRAGGVVEHGFRGAWVRYACSAWKLPGVIYE